MPTQGLLRCLTRSLVMIYSVCTTHSSRNASDDDAEYVQAVRAHNASSLAFRGL